MAVGRVVFCLVYGIEFVGPEVHGIMMDCSVAGYITAVYALIYSLSAAIPRRGWVKGFLTGWSAIFALLFGVVYSLDLALYGYWGFRLDTTPIFYFTTSPAAAMASVGAMEMIVGGLVVVVWFVAVFLTLRYITLRKLSTETGQSRWGESVASLLFAGLMFIPIRGSLTVSTMNLSRAYYSEDKRLNHAAINPIFSLQYSASHKGIDGSQYQFFSEEELTEILGNGDMVALRDSSLYLTNNRPDVYIIILESFSEHLFPDVAERLDSVGREGWHWKNFYATGFRTDRGIPSILSGLPTQPGLSLMKYAEKAERLPSIASELKRQGGYGTAYWYGGDANFTNMQAYVYSTGFERLVSDKDFAVNERMSKWGAPDHVLFKRLESELPREGAGPQLIVVQTSSSHEPFEVDYSNPRFADSPQRNAFAYTDSVVGAFLDRVRENGRPYIAVLVADHYGAWPPADSLPDIRQRHHVPLIITGNVLSAHGVAAEGVGSQTDIAATVLGLLGMDGGMFPFSNDLLDTNAPRRALLVDPEEATLVEGDGRTGIYNFVTGSESGDQTATQVGKAYIQQLFDYITKL